MTKGQTPITDDWLSSCGFGWRQGERQPNKHWSLKCNAERRGMIEQTGIEVQRCGWENHKGDYIGDPGEWMLWITDTFDRTAFVGTIRWQEQITGLAEIITDRPWNPDTHLYGQAWPVGSRVLLEKKPA